MFIKSISMYKLLLTFISFLLLSIPVSGQANCPNSGCDAGTPTEVSTCLSSGNTELNITSDLTIAAPTDLSGISICVKNNTLTLESGVLINGSTSFTDLGGSSTGAAITIGATTYNFNDSNSADGTIDELNAIIALGTSGNIGAAVLGLLPVELSHYSAAAEKNAVSIKWTTSSESGNAYFILEHSTDGKDFKEITTIEGQGNSDIEHHYAYRHLLPVNGINYYRLWQFDYDGQYENLGTVSVKKDEQATVSIAPNPVFMGNEINLSATINGHNFKQTTFFLVNSNGQRTSLSLKGENTLVLPTGISKGLYFLQLIKGNEQQVLPIQVQ